MAAGSPASRTFIARTLTATGAPLLPATNCPPTTTNYPSISVEFGEGIEYTAQAVQHEEDHFIIRNNHGLPDPTIDADRDRIPDALEITKFMGVNTATNTTDTYNLQNSYEDFNPKDGDEEIRCLYQMNFLRIQFFPEKDWANPGCQHKDQCGPRPDKTP